MGAFQNAEEGLGLKPDLIIVIGNPDLAPPLKLRRYAVMDVNLKLKADMYLDRPTSVYCLYRVTLLQ